MNGATRLAPLGGLRWAGSGVAFPRDANPEAPALDNEGVAAFLATHGVPVEEGLDPFARWGCRHRQWARAPGAEQAFTDVAAMAVVAGRRALHDASCAATDIDLVLVATSTPDRITSSLAARVAKGLGMGCGAVDVRGGGAGGLLALLHGATMLRCGLSRVLVVASEAGAGFVAPHDVAGVHLYADGAAALVVEAAVTSGGLVTGATGVRGATGRPFTVPGPLPPAAAALERGDYCFARPDAAYLQALRGMWTDACRDLAASHDPSDLAAFLPYPVTRDQIAAAGAAAGVSADRVVAPLAAHGVLGGAGCLASVHHVLQQGTTGRIGLAAVAGGMVWATMVWEHR